MEKITCATCVNEENKRCVVKKSKVAINKRRNCDKYILEATKVKAKQILKIVRMSHVEKEVLRNEYKQQLRQLRVDAKNGGFQQNSRHPITGDLSRFSSTAGSDRSGG